jgi:hypothetical protein
LSSGRRREREDQKKEKGKGTEEEGEREALPHFISTWGHNALQGGEEDSVRELKKKVNDKELLEEGTRSCWRKEQEKGQHRCAKHPGGRSPARTINSIQQGKQGGQAKLKKDALPISSCPRHAFTMAKGGRQPKKWRGRESNPGPHASLLWRC